MNPARLGLAWQHTTNKPVDEWKLIHIDAPVDAEWVAMNFAFTYI